jgi:hypothetical protein
VSGKELALKGLTETNGGAIQGETFEQDAMHIQELSDLLDLKSQHNIQQDCEDQMIAPSLIGKKESSTTVTKCSELGVMNTYLTRITAWSFSEQQTNVLKRLKIMQREDLLGSGLQIYAYDSLPPGSKRFEIRRVSFLIPPDINREIHVQFRLSAETQHRKNTSLGHNFLKILGIVY